MVENKVDFIRFMLMIFRETTVVPSSSHSMREALDQTSFRLNRQAARTKNATIHMISTPKRRPGEYHEGLGIIPAPVLDETGPMVTPMSEPYTVMGLNSRNMQDHRERSVLFLLLLL